MKYLLFLFIPVVFLYSCYREPVEDKDFFTVCNPMDLSYRFRPEKNQVSRREAADPTLIKYKGLYWLFASKSGGYWFSEDLKAWNFVISNQFPTEAYAPTVIVMDDTLFMAVSSKQIDEIYKTTDPMKGEWISENTLSKPVEDPCFFQDDDERLFLYWGCSNEKPLYGAEIDRYTFKFVGDIRELIYPQPDKYGWEVRGDYNTRYDDPPWLEGLWMNKLNNKYYLQYSAPGTLEKSYSDGVYVSDSPLGPFFAAEHNPFSYKPEGFACGAGHGSTITDNYGNLWHAGTISLSVRHKFERRIGFYPSYIDSEGIFYTYTRFGDYPMIIPDRKVEKPEDLFPGWMLLSYRKKVSVSSSLKGYPPENLCDENIRTWWSAETDNNTEWAMIDLGANYDIFALQVNFADHNASIYDRQENLSYRYIIEVSEDKAHWKIILNSFGNLNDNPHDYSQLPDKVNARYLRIKNTAVPDGLFSLSGLRIFGKGRGNPPQGVDNFTVNRNVKNKRSASLSWDPVKDATGYNISFGTHEDRLYHNYLVYTKNKVEINSLNVDKDYYFAIQAFNENGVSELGKQKKIVGISD